MPSPYQLPDRWLEGVWRKVMSDPVALQKQIDCLQRLVDDRKAAQAAVLRLTEDDKVLAAAYWAAPFNVQYADDTATLQDVLANLKDLAQWPT